MQAVGRLGSYITQGVYTVSAPFHPFGGAVDIVVVEQQDGSFKSSPWYVRFGKFQGVLKAREKVVDISVNGIETDFHMYLDHRGEAFFLRDVNAEEEGESVTYPPSSGDYIVDTRSLKSKSCNFDTGTSNSVAQIAMNDAEIVTRTNSRRERILGLVLGQRSSKGDFVDDDVNKVERAEIAANLLELRWSTNLASPRKKDRENAQGISLRADKADDGLHHRKLSDDACSSTEQHGISSNSKFEVGQEKGVTNLSTRIDVEQEGELDPKLKKVIYDIGSTSSDLQVERVELESRLEKQLNGEFDISTYGVQSLVNCKTSESSKLGMNYCIEQTHEVLNLASGEVHVHKEVLHSETILLPEGTETEEVIQSFNLGMPVAKVTDVHAQQTDYFDSDGNRDDVAGVNTGLGHFSTEKVESNYVTNLDDQALDNNNIKDKDVCSTLSFPLESIGDCFPQKSKRRSAGSEEEFLFSDLDESSINDKFEGSIYPEHVDEEFNLSYEMGTKKEGQLAYANCNLHSSLENSTTENQTRDLEKLRGMSSPIAIPINENAGKEVGQQYTESLPNMSSSINILGQDNVCYPLSQSLDSKSASFQWTFPGNDDTTCLKSVKDQENKLPHKEPGDNDDHSSGDFKSTDVKLPIGDPLTESPSPGGNWRIWPFSLRGSRSRKAVLPAPIDVKSTTSGSSSESTTNANKNELRPNLMQNKIRENTPTSEQLGSLNLKEGRNIITFTFSTAMLGKQQVDAHIYLWKWNTRIVISDVDGTITRSDVLGQFMPLVGVDWSQTGVAHLFSAIKENGYQLLFLSARSISQAYLTRHFLLNLKQDGKVLPDGPVIISPDGLFPSLYREVIRRAPHEFKIACLEVIRALFPSDCNPFYAGFGNRDTDEVSYLKVGIPLGKIFIINPRGEIVVNRSVDTKSYTSLRTLVNGMFPPTNSSEQEDFNSWNFWKLPPPDIDI